MKVWRPKEINRLPPGDLWLDFLWYNIVNLTAVCSDEEMVAYCRYYVKEFDWTRQVVSVKQFKPLWKFDKLWQAKPMCIEGELDLSNSLHFVLPYNVDPFNLDHNLAQAVSPRSK